MSDLTQSTRRGAHAVYPGTFDPFTPGHLDVVDRMRGLFDQITVLVAVNEGKRPAATQAQRLTALRAMLPAEWSNVAVTAWTGLTAAFCHQHQCGVIVRGLRNHADLRQEYRLAAMNEELGITTLFVPARPGLAAISATAVRALRTR